jgi:glycosyltransferase involved in cell wall biosynthesis
MYISGFTFIRNAITYDYPVEEAIRSILPLCDEVVVAVGNSTDDTRRLIASIAPGKIRIIDTVWDESLRHDGHILAVETNKALDAISTESDWAIYIQGDEVMHEDSLDEVRDGMMKWQNNRRVEGLLFNYRHFWGSYDWVGDSRKWYRREVRIIRRNATIRSYKDAQGFRSGERKLRVKPLNAWVHHYGWVKPPVAQQAKQQEFHKYWHDETWIREHVSTQPTFDYSIINSLVRFEGTHPAVMQERIRRQHWQFEPGEKVKPLSRRHALLDKLEKHTGIQIGIFRNYRIV